MSFSLDQLAQQTVAELHGDAACAITGIAPLQSAGQGHIAFLTDSKYVKYLKTTQASAVILKPEHLADCPVSALVTDNPYLIYAKVATLLVARTEQPAGIHPHAVVDTSASIHASAWIGPGAIVEASAVIGENVFIGPACVIGANCHVARDSRLVARVTLCHGTQVGARALIHPGAVIGSDGFGLANDGGRWINVPQVGCVRLGDDVEVGANTTIDRGALEDTVISNGVKLDNQIQIAHNVHIGEHTAMAGCSGIAGSTHLGSHCTVGGGVGIAGHLVIADNVHFSGMSLVTRSYKTPGYYSGNMPSMPNKDWRKAIAWIRRLDEMMNRLKSLEKRLSQVTDKK